MRRKLAIGCGVAVLLVSVVLVGEKLPSFGGRSEGSRLERMEASPLFKNGKAQNLIETSLGMNTKMFGAMRRNTRGGQEPKVQDHGRRAQGSGPWDKGLGPWSWAQDHGTRAQDQGQGSRA